MFVNWLLKMRGVVEFVIRNRLKFRVDGRVAEGGVAQLECGSRVYITPTLLELPLKYPTPK